jgi:hypothetical protein
MPNTKVPNFIYKITYILLFELTKAYLELSGLNSKCQKQKKDKQFLRFRLFSTIKSFKSSLLSDLFFTRNPKTHLMFGDWWHGNIVSSMC